MLKLNFIQMAWIVEDIEIAMKEWTDTHPVGPFFLVPNVMSQDARCYGDTTSFCYSGAMAQGGDMQIELVQQHDEGRSIYRDSELIASRRPHHVGALANDIDLAIDHYKKRGFPLALEGNFGDIRYAYVDTRPTIGCFTEIVQDGPLIQGLTAIVSEAANSWDGQNPIRLLSDYFRPN